MPYIRIPIQRKHTFVPDAAGAIGGSWRSVADQVRSVASGLHSIGSALDGSWEGNSKQHFMTEYDPTPGATESSADLLDSLAGQVEGITVTEWETDWEKVWSVE
jgi:uncharacterized protein YukE